MSGNYGKLNKYGGTHEARLRMTLQKPCSNCGRYLKPLMNTDNPIYAYCTDCGLLRALIIVDDQLVEMHHLPEWIESSALEMFNEERRVREENRETRAARRQEIEAAFAELGVL